MEPADVVFGLLVIGFLAVAYSIVRRTRQRRAAWASGLTARARVVRQWRTTQVVNNLPRTTQWHEYDFTTADGRAVVFKEGGGPHTRGVGDEVAVHYTAEDPERATAVAPQPGKDTASMILALVLLGVGVLLLLGLWVSGP
ncbi:DUF3592 domain-containing protein [Streptomyces sp. NPDC005811]|uniref:DUF3592 domain-containing protein n=1 Tax=Streptomyces sp. NPDC005811 TaxID=3154565 RepID=UPI003404D549